MQNNSLMSSSNGEMRVMKLPIGFRFRPTDEELVVHYLKRKALSLPLPASVIPDQLNVFLSDPWSLPGNLREKRYHFWKRERSKCSRIMATTSGFWKAVGKIKPIVPSPGINDVVGCRKSWAFHQVSNNFPHGHRHCFKTCWFMHEFQLLETQNQTGESQEDWVVCRVFQRKMKTKNNKIQGNFEESSVMSNKDESNFAIIDSPSYIDFRVENIYELGPPQPSSPSSVSRDSC